MDKILVLNNKCNFQKDQYEKYLKEIENIGYKNIILCPSMCYLNENINVELCGQNVSKYNMDNLTGDITARQLSNLGVKYCLVGHYERIMYYNESDLDIRKKLLNLLDNGVKPILVIGEELDDYLKGKSVEVVMKRLKTILEDIDVKDIIIAYEAYYAVGKNVVPKVDVIENVITNIKKVYNTKVLYGGSVNLDNIALLEKLKCIDGYVLGKLSLDANKIEKLIKVL